MRKSLCLILFFLAVLASALVARDQNPQALAPIPGQSPQPPAAQQQLAPPQPVVPAQVPPQATLTGPLIVLDPAHGGTDPGARGQNGVIEKDIVLQFARAVRIELVRQGYRTVLTRDDDSNPSYDDRAATANSFHDSIFVSLHLSSTGTFGVARAYFYQFWTSFAPLSTSPALTASQPAATPVPPAANSSDLIPWNEAQRSYADTSHRLADLMQAELAQTFSGSPSASSGVAIRGLRSVAAPAVAIEISSVSVSRTNALGAMAAPLASCIAKTLLAFRPPNSAGAK